MTHPDSEALFQMLDGELQDEASVVEIRAHVADCPQCSAVLDVQRGLGGALRVWADTLPGGDFDLTDAVMAGLEASAATAPVVKSGSSGQSAHPTGAKVYFLRRWMLPTLVAAAAAVMFVVGHSYPRVKPQGSPTVVPSVANTPAAAGASVARVEVVGAQSYAVLEVPGIQDGAVTSVVWIQDDPEDPVPDESPMAVE